MKRMIRWRKQFIQTIKLQSVLRNNVNFNLPKIDFFTFFLCASIKQTELKKDFFDN